MHTNEIKPSSWGECKTADAIVVARAKGTLLVAVPKHATAEQGCHRCGQCPSRQSELRFRIRLPRPEQYPVGRIIRIQWYSLNRAMAGAIVFGMPVVLCIAALSAWVATHPASAGSPYLVLVAISGLACGFGVGVFLEYGSRHFFPPQIVP
jgi:hypothetical protein